jgi:hypothetical protein
MFTSISKTLNKSNPISGMKGIALSTGIILLLHTELELEVGLYH